MKRVNFTDEQIRALHKQYVCCIKFAQIDGKFNSDSFFSAIETSLKILDSDRYLYIDRDED